MENIVKKIKKAHREFEKLEPRSYIYRISRELIKSKWKNDQKVTETICLLLQIWNAALYRYSFFDIKKLKNWITKNKRELNRLKEEKVTIDKIKEKKYATMAKRYFEELIEATKIETKKKNKKQIKRSPVGVAKILHLLLPKLFPLWDNAIAKGMGTYWNSQKKNYSEKYLQCCIKTLKFQNKRDGKKRGNSNPKDYR